MSILSFLGLDKKKLTEQARGGRARTAETETVRKVVDALDQMEPMPARYSVGMGKDQRSQESEDTSQREL